jgi:hypothetical protein
MKLLQAAAFVATCAMVGLWAWTGVPSEHSRSIQVERGAGEERMHDQHAARLAEDSTGAFSPPVEVERRVEIFEPDFDLPDSHWLPPPTSEPELEHPDGPWLRLHENGVVDEQGAYENDLEVGVWRWWYENGERKAIGRFEAGKRVGTWTWWHDNGNVLMEGQYEDDEGFGPWRTYHENGARWGEGQYLDGEIGGRWSFWFDDGTLDEHRTGVYVNGALVE